MGKKARNLFLLLVAFVLLIPCIGLAQQAPQKINVLVERTEDGVTEIVEEEIEMGQQGGASIDDILQQYGIATEFGQLSAHEEVEIIIRRKTKDLPTQDTRVVLDPQPEITVRQLPYKEVGTGEPFLGVFYHEFMDAEQPRALINSVIANSGAQIAGLKRGDRILAVDGNGLSPDHSLQSIIQAHKPGDKVSLTILRDEQTKKIVAELGESTRKIFDWEEMSIGKLMDESDLPASVQSSANIKDGDRPFLGVTGKNAEEGVEITSIVPRSTAASLGLQTGDVLTSLNGEALTSWNEMATLLREMNSGEEINLQVLRTGQQLDLSGELLSRNKTYGQPGAVREVRILIKMEDVTFKDVMSLGQEASAPGITTQNSLKTRGLSFFPNPNGGKFTLAFYIEEEGDTDVRIFDLNGQTVFEETLDNFTGHYKNSIDISDAARGIYFLQITQNGKSVNKKIVTQ